MDVVDLAALLASNTRRAIDTDVKMQVVIVIPSMQVNSSTDFALAVDHSGATFLIQMSTAQRTASNTGLSVPLRGFALHRIHSTSVPVLAKTVTNVTFKRFTIPEPASGLFIAPEFDQFSDAIALVVGKSAGIVPPFLARIANRNGRFFVFDANGSARLDCQVPLHLQIQPGFATCESHLIVNALSSPGTLQDSIALTVTNGTAVSMRDLTTVRFSHLPPRIDIGKLLHITSYDTLDAQPDCASKANGPMLMVSGVIVNSTEHKNVNGGHKLYEMKCKFDSDALAQSFTVNLWSVSADVIDQCPTVGDKITIFCHGKKSFRGVVQLNASYHAIDGLEGIIEINRAANSLSHPSSPTPNPAANTSTLDLGRAIPVPVFDDIDE